MAWAMVSDDDKNFYDLHAVPILLFLADLKTTRMYISLFDIDQTISAHLARREFILYLVDSQRQLYMHIDNIYQAAMLQYDINTNSPAHCRA